MATVTMGWKLWDSVDGIACCSAGDSGTGAPGDVVQCFEGWNPRGAQLTPYINCDTGIIRWDLNDNVAEYPAVTGARNGIAVTDPTTGVITVWDVSGDGGETVGDKLQNFLPICNCADCEGTLTELNGEYECNYPTVEPTSYCYDVTFTGDGSPLPIRKLAMRYQAYRTGDFPTQTSYNLNTGSTIARMCLDRPIAEIGALEGYTFALV